MADIEKVVKGLECCEKKYPRNAWCEYCPYEPDCYHDSICDLLVHDALALLKSQQAEIERLKAQPTIIETEHFKYVFPKKGGVPDACKNCSNHPSNGGSGNCNCMLGIMGKVTY